jgi:hypothetical protein
VNEWAKAVVHPLGLAGFALFLLFLLLSKTRKPDDQRLLSRVFLIAALASLVGGLGLSYLQVGRAPAAPTPTQVSGPHPQENRDIQQNTTGPGSPAIQGVQGNVNVNNSDNSGSVPTKRQADETRGVK